MTRVLVIATSKKTRGGITAVLKLYEQSEMWQQYHCWWIGTHRDGNILCKLWYLGKALIQYLVLLPFFDIVHFHLSEPTSAKRKTIFYKMAKWLGKIIVVHFHSFSPDTTIYSKYRDRYRYLFSNANAVIVLSNHWKRIVNEVFNLGEIVRPIHNPCPIPDNHTKYEKTKKILYAGTLNQRKGYSDFIIAFAKIATRHPEWSIVFAGNGEMELAKELVQSLGIENQVELLGWVSGEDKHRAFCEATAFCLPSYAEGFPMAVLDAWAYGLPVITTPVGGIPDVAVDGENMLLFCPGDIDTLANKLEMIISDKALRDKMSAESLKLAKGKFSLETVTKQVGEIYEELLK